MFKRNPGRGIPWLSTDYKSGIKAFISVSLGLIPGQGTKIL